MATVERRGNRLAPVGFDFTGAMRRLCLDLSSRLEELQHVDVGRVAIGFSQTRKPVRHGLQATLTPLRFSGGGLYTRRGRRRYTVQRLFDREGREMLYILRFYLPRFLDQPFEEKLTTVVHELWHIGPEFDGDLRRFPGRCFAHSASERQYDAFCQALADKWLRQSPPAEAVNFLRARYAQLKARHGTVRGDRIPAPKLLPIGEP
ncbi:MAG: hypothetical protein K2Y37_10100 [Pirellulales bacterium]|nr:hypothetical protein [Pirellulales bacterium]